MKKQYDKLSIQILNMDVVDIITASSGNNYNNNGDNEVDAGGEW